MTVRTFPERRSAPTQGGSSYNYPAAKKKGVPPVSGMSPFTVFGAAPEIRVEEVDQTDPAGRYRMGSVSDNFVMERSGAANWANVLGSASNFAFLDYNNSNKFVGLSAQAADDWYLRLLAGLTASKVARIDLNAGTSSNIVLSVGGTTVMTIQGGATQVVNVVKNIDMGGASIVNATGLQGKGTVGLYLRSWKLVTDAAAQRIIGDVLDPATDTVYQVFAAVPKAATPLFTFAGSDYVPTTSELDADHFYIGYTKATNTATLYMNEGGVILTLPLGVMA